MFGLTMWWNLKGRRGLRGKAGTGFDADGARPVKKSRILCQGAAARHAVMVKMRPDYPMVDADFFPASRS